MMAIRVREKNETRNQISRNVRHTARFFQDLLPAQFSPHRFSNIVTMCLKFSENYPYRLGTGFDQISHGSFAVGQ